MGAKGDTWVSIQIFTPLDAFASCPLFNPADETFSASPPPRRNYFSLPPSAQEITERPYRSDRKLNGLGEEGVSRYAASRLPCCCVIKSNPRTLLRGRRKLLSPCQHSEPLFVVSLLFRHTHARTHTHAESLSLSLFHSVTMFLIHFLHSIYRGWVSGGRGGYCHSHAALLIFAEQSGGFGQPESQTPGEDREEKSFRPASRYCII